MGKDKKQTVTQRLDKQSQGFVDSQRRQAQSAADVALTQPGSFFGDDTSIEAVLANAQGFLNPFTDQVIGGVNQQFDQARAAATRRTNQESTAAGAFGGSRHGLTEGSRLAALDRDQAGVVGGLLSNQFNTALGQGFDFSQVQRAQQTERLQEPLFRNQAAQGFFNAGLGPVGGSTQQVQKGSVLKDVLGAGLTVAGGMIGGPAGAAAGANAGFDSFLQPAPQAPLFRRGPGNALGRFG